MSRPLRIDIEDGWYTVCARGIERRTIFCDSRHCEHFLELLEEASGRFCVEVHAYVLMGNHYHLIVRTPNANLSRAMQWVNVSYSAWFNVKHQRTGHLFQGRFGSRLIDGEGAWLLQASVYLHLNPVRVVSQGLNKSSNRAESLGLKEPTDEEIKRRLKVLRDHFWSSYPVYAGYRRKPAWLITGNILSRGGGREQYRRYVQSYVTRGKNPEEYDSVRDRLVIGSERFLDRIRLLSRSNAEQPQRHELRKFASLEDVVKVVETIRGESWETVSGCRGDWGFPLALYLARKRTGLSLREIGDWCGGMEYKTVSKRIERFAAKLRDDKALAKSARKGLDQLSNVET